MRTFWIMVGMVPALASGKPALQVGVAFRLNEKYDTTVQAFTKGIQTAKKLFEEQNRVKIEIKEFPYGSTLESRVAAAEAINRSTVAAVMGGEMTEEALVLGEIMASSGKVLLTPTASNPKVTQDRPHVFRACFSDDVVGERLARYAAKHLKPKRVGIFHNVSSPYTDYLSTRFREVYQKEKEAGAEVIVEKVLRNTLDVGPIVERFKAAGVDLVVMFTHDSDLQRFAARAAKADFHPAYLGSDGWGSNGFVQQRLVKETEGGDKFKGYRNVYWREDRASSRSKQFRTRFRKQHGSEPTAWAAMAFDTAWILFHALKAASDPSSSTAVRESLAAVALKDLVTTDQFRFGENRSPTRDLYIYRIDRTGIHYEVTLP